MKQTLIALVLVALIVSSSAVKQKSHKKHQKHIVPDYSKYTDNQIKSIFTELKNMPMGLEVFTTIQLEMTSGNGDWIDTSLEVLEDLNKGTTDKLKGIQTELNGRRNYCDEKIDQISASISRNEKAIAEAAASIPVLQEETVVKKSTLMRLDSEMDVKIRLLDNLNKLNDEYRAAYVAGRTAHDDMISALSQAKVYVGDLKENNFLQKSNSPALAQIQSHAKESIDKLTLNHHRKMFFYLAEVSNALAAQADGKLIDQVLNLIDELMDYQKNAQQIDFEVEELRVEKYEADRDNFVSQMETIGEMVTELTSELIDIQKKITLLKDNIDEGNGFVVLKKEEHHDLDRACSDDIERFQLTINTNRQLLELLNECIGLFSAKAKEIRNSIQSI